MTSDFTIPAAASFLGSLSSANVLAADNALLQIMNDYKNGVKGFDILKFYKNTATLASDTLALAVANMTRYVVVDTEGAAATDNLSTISGGSDGQVLYLIAANAGRVITAKHNVGNIKFSAGTDWVLSADKVTKLFYNGSNWSDEGAALATQVNTQRTVLGSNLGSVTISSIPTAYKHLLLMIEARTDIAGTSDSLILRFNADATAANYYSQYAIESAASVAAAEILGIATGAFLPNAAVGSTGSAGNGAALVWIFNYASTTMRRVVISECGAMAGTTTGLVKAGRSKAFWTNAAAAISSITFLPSGGSNILANSAYTLYGFN